jgi:DNA modification methylase
MTVQIITGDARDRLRELPDASVHCCVTSPPYFGLRDYGVEGQMGLESTPAEFVAGMVALFREVRRVLRDDGTLWLNLGDSYNAAGRTGHGTRTGFKQVTNRASANGADIVRPNVTALKEKDLIGIPWRVAFALQADGWYLRQDIIWAKPNPMPESVRDRCTKAHEYLFLLSKSARYYFDADAIAEDAMKGDAGSLFTEGKTGEHQLGRASGRRHLPGNKTHKGLTAYEGGASEHRTKSGLVAYSSKVAADPDQMLTRNKRSVWTVATQPFKEAHFATFPPALIEPCILAGCPVGGTVLDPFGGAGTTGLVSDRLQRDAILIELNPAYAEMARQRIVNDAGLFGEVA